MLRKWTIIGSVFLLFISLGLNVVQYRSSNRYIENIESQKQSVSQAMSRLANDMEWFGTNGTEGEIRMFCVDTGAVSGMTRGNRLITKNALLDEAMHYLTKLFNNEQLETIKLKSSKIAPFLRDLSKDIDNEEYCKKIIDIVAGR